MISRCRQVREYCFTHRAHVGDCHGRNVQLQSVRAAQKQGMHFMRHSRTVGFKKPPCISLLPLSRICTDIFCAFLTFIKLLQNFKCHLQTALPTWQREQSAPPHSTCLDTCPCMRAQKKRCLHLLDEKSHSAEFCSAVLFAQPTRRILSSIAIGTRSTQLFVRNLSLVLTHCPNSSSCHCKESTCQTVPARFSTGRVHSSVKLTILACKKAHKPERSAPCTVALNTLHFKLALTGAFQIWPNIRNAFRSRRNKFVFPSLWRMTCSRSACCPSISL